jgi:hypothetical protein
MQSYRYYCLDGAGKLHNAEWLEANSDEEAVEFIRAKHPDGQCEIWEGQRLVAKVRLDGLATLATQLMGQ